MARFHCLIGVALLSIMGHVAAREPAPVHFTVARYEVSGDNPLSPGETRSLLAPYTGEQAGIEQLEAATRTLEKALISRGYSFHRVVLPPQTLEGGVVRLRVVAIRLGQVRVTGNRRLGRDQILRALPPLAEGTTPNTRELARSLSLANRQPGRRLLISMKQGTGPGTIDAEVKVEEQRPYTLFTDASNIGTERTGSVRLSVGGQLANALGHDDSFTAVYTFSHQQPDKVNQYGLSYTMPLYPLASSVTAFYTRSTVDTGTVGDFEVSGAGRFFGLELTHLLLRRGNYAHQFSVGLQDRLFENNALFNAAVNLASDVRSRPLSFRYQGRYQKERARLQFHLGVAVNTGGGHLNDQAHYTAVRVGADSQWKVLQFGAEAGYTLPHAWQLRAVAEGQLTEDALIPGEQFGMGGAGSVRGFQERAVVGDSGVRMSAELWSPPVTFLPGLRGLLFLDSGYRDLNVTLPGESSGDFIASIGAGLRWQWRRYASLTLDYGHVINAARQLASTADKGNVKWHFNFLLRY